MENIYQLSEEQILTMALILLRVSAFIFVWPIFGSQDVPPQVKILFSLIVSFLLYNPVRAAMVVDYQLTNEIMWLAIREVTVGLILGVITRMFFMAISVGGQLINTAMGLGSAQLFNPTMGEHGSVVEQFQITIATLFFLFINGHHVFLTGLSESFQIIPISLKGLNLDNFKTIAVLGQEILLIGVKLSAPVMVALFITNLAMGIIGRAVPQMNVLLTSVSATVLLGIFILLITMPIFVVELKDLLNHMGTKVFEVMKVL